MHTHTRTLTLTQTHRMTTYIQFSINNLTGKVVVMISMDYIYMYTYMDRKRVCIRSSPRTFYTTIRVTRKLMVAGAAITVLKKSLSTRTAPQGQRQVFVAQLSTFQFRKSVRGLF